jgi:manganese-transporting P-type ATPase
MILRGVRLFDEATTNGDEDLALLRPEETDLPWETVRIMAACHSLAPISPGNRKVIGDPLEKSVMKSTGYKLIGSNTVAPANEPIRVECKPVTILHRFAFSSKLKRMTVLVSEAKGDNRVWALTKGAPETIKDFLSKKSLPQDFDAVSFHHMNRGRRVLAMAYRDVGPIGRLQELKDSGRDAIERNLVFAGFLVLDCPLKPDSKSVISELRKSGHKVAMITGDAMLTAAEVARQVGIIRPSIANQEVYQIRKKETSILSIALDPLSLFECIELCSNAENPNSFDLVELWQKSRIKNVALCISGEALVSVASAATQMGTDSGVSLRDSKVDEKAILLSPSAQAVLSRLVGVISVFARHAPQQKEAVIAALNHGGHQTLMCGDGTNDVGALKRAHVGISIISAPEVEKKQREAAATITLAKRTGEKATKRSKVKTPVKTKTVEESLRQLREAQDDLDRVELGDASIAAPFTSRAVSIKCCKDVIQQGRCTLVTMIQIYKILGIKCLVNALVLSKLFIHGGKQGDRQLTILGIGVAALFFFVTRAEPLPTLSPIRPPSSVLSWQTFVSIAGQCLIHIAAILSATEIALAYVDPYDPSLVPDGPFNPNILNTCTFLLTCLSTSKCMRQRTPWGIPLLTDRALFRSLPIC